MHSRFLDALDYLQNQPASVDDAETTTPRTPTSQEHSKGNVLLCLNETVMPIFGGGISGGYNQTTIDRIKTNLHILQQNQNTNSRTVCAH